MRAHAHCYPETRQEAPPSVKYERLPAVERSVRGMVTVQWSDHQVLLQTGENGNGDALNVGASVRDGSHGQ